MKYLYPTPRDYERATRLTQRTAINFDSSLIRRAAAAD